MASLTNHFVRRGVEIAQTVRYNPAADAVLRDGLPPWGATLVLATIFVFLLVIASISYTYGEVVTTLAAVEAPQSTTITCTPPEYSDAIKEPLLSEEDKVSSIDVEEILIQTRPLTSRFCAIRRHLRARGGRLARWRGLHVYLISELAQGALTGLLTSFTRSTCAYIALDLAVFVLFTRWQLLWTHMVISEPNSKPFLKRMLPLADVKKALMSTFAYAVLVRVSLFAVLYLSAALTGNKLDLYLFQIQLRGDGSSAVTTLLLSIIALMLFAFNIVAFQIPALVAITRVRASLLSVEEEPIISFDRTFNGQVVPGATVLGFWQGWTGCDLATRLRVLKVVLKTFALQVFVMLFAGLVLLAELRLILGSEWLNAMSGVVADAMAGNLALAL